MDSANGSIIISCKESILENQPPLPPSKQHRRNYKTRTIFFSLIILVVILISSSIVSSFICRRKEWEPFQAYRSSSARFYCDLTMFPQLCYDSMPSIINTTVLKSNPGPILSGSILVATNELSTITNSMTMALSTSTTKNSLVEARFSKCKKWVHDSLSRLNESLSTLGVDSDIVSLTSEEMDNIKVWTMAALSSGSKCLWALKEADKLEGQEKTKVEELKLGLQKARKSMINSIGLLNARDSILEDFDDPFMRVIYYDYCDIVDAQFVVFLYVILYLYIALLYLLFWRI